jgi:TonB family protein
MLTQLIESGRPYGSAQKPLPFTISAGIHLTIGSLLLVFPLLFPQTLSDQIKNMVGLKLFFPLPRAKSGAIKLMGKPANAGAARSSTRFQLLSIPPFPNRIVDNPAVNHSTLENFTEAIGAISGGTLDGVPDGILGEAIPSMIPTPATSEPIRAEPRPERSIVGGDVQQANLIFRVIPIYPGVARNSHIQGVVILFAIIGRDGAIQELKVISGHPLLIQAALEAVKKWRYRPTTLNGVPIPVETTIAVNFSLSH